MTGMASQFSGALQEEENRVTDSGLIVKILRHRHSSYPGHDVPGVLPMVVIGHQSMEEKDWRRWVRDNSIPHYGAAFTEKMVEHGVALREMLPTAAFGRQMRDYRKGVRDWDRNYSCLDRVEQILTVVEKWPSLYSLVADEMSEEPMTLDQFCDRVMQLPPPTELARGAYTTLGDLIANPAGDPLLLPDY